MVDEQLERKLTLAQVPVAVWTPEELETRASQPSVCAHASPGGLVKMQIPPW